MKCNNCGEYRETAQDVRACRRCQDGTAQQIPVAIDGDTPLIEVCEHLPGLANRFVPGSAPVEDAEPTPGDQHDEPTASTTTSDNAAPAAAAKQKPARKAASKRATRH